MSSDVQKQIQALQLAMAEKIRNADKDKVKFVTYACAEVERVAKTSMRDTTVNPDVAYGKHHPSMPGYAPAPDTGTLMQSVTHSVEVGSNGEVYGEVGSILKNPDYPRYLEFGTSKMQPRPWLGPALEKSRAFIQNLAKEIFGK